MKLKYMIAIPFLFICFLCNQKEQEIFDSTPEMIFEPAVSAGVIRNLNLEEASGLMASRNNPDMFWAVNDSGNKPILFLINDKAELMHSYWFQDLENRDWEDLSMYEDKPSGRHKLVIADIGDNSAVRDHIEIIILDEPAYSMESDTIIREFKKHKLKYPDGPKDAETVLCDPVTSQMYIISKREENVSVFEVPEHLSTSAVMELKLVSKLPFTNVTSGDISPDGGEILLKTYDEVYYWRRDNRQVLTNVLAQEYVTVDYKVEPQGEAICWKVDGSGFYTLSEKSWSDRQILYYYNKRGEN
ncbi:MAG: hypothetical protein MI975_12070 [Cytophagales bacterium]|nr:hypothetical protein [Cytophagales bacterium]